MINFAGQRWYVAENRLGTAMKELIPPDSTVADIVDSLDRPVGYVLQIGSVSV
jgi:hypothetical protein